jgi:DNA-binding HxlR family transcriptional regulator
MIENAQKVSNSINMTSSQTSTDLHLIRNKVLSDRVKTDEQSGRYNRYDSAKKWVQVYKYKTTREENILDIEAWIR